MRYITNVRCVVRVDGKAVVVDASTHLPEGVAPEEIARLLRFGVIREAPPTTEVAKAPAVKRTRKDAPLEVSPSVVSPEVPEVSG